MSSQKQQEKINYNKISDLIKDVEENFHNFDPMIWNRSRKEEICAPIDGVITGTIPKWIKGSLFANGPGAFQIGDITLNHVFDGMALLHRFHIEEGKATYQCRFIKSESYNGITQQKKMIASEFGTTIVSNGSFFQKLKAYLFQKDKPTDNTLVTVYPIDDEIYAFTETPIIRRFDPETLETLESVNLNESTNIVFQPAHPHVWNKKLYNCGTSISSQGSFYIIFCVPDGDNKFNNVEIIAKIPAKRRNYPGYMHSFGMTENYFVIIEQPFSMPLIPLLFSTYTKTPICNIMKVVENEKNYIYLVDRTTGKVKYTYETEEFFYFHTINQYEDEANKHVVLDLICFKNVEVYRGFLINNLKKLKDEKIKTNMMNSRALRFVMPLDVPKNGTKENENLVTLEGSEAKAFLKADGTVFCAPELLFDSSIEFGTVYYEKYMGRPYKYFYSIGLDVHSEFPGKLYKIDLENKTVLTWQEENAYPGEPIFIPKGNGKEDEGVVVSSVLYGDPDSNRVVLLFLDATTFKEIARCEFKDLAEPVTKTFHGWYVDDRRC